ncbi:unnamed protein product [Cylicostephanus goldi]|uniref:Uncharacterized protein n=1 Tax=Cylicostephanus goldi TaxID=71465 RepID=A0A3P6TS60_CYLGO|nr:unnamed protein product [Cylicostephanus goldi]
MFAALCQRRFYITFYARQKNPEGESKLERILCFVAVKFADVFFTYKPPTDTYNADLGRDAVVPEGLPAQLARLTQ